MGGQTTDYSINNGVLINGNDSFSAYGAKLLSKDIQTATVVTYTDWLRKGINPLTYEVQNKTIKISMEFLISGKTENEARHAISYFISEFSFKKAYVTLKFDNIDFYYDGILSETPTITQLQYGSYGNESYYSVEIKIDAGYAYLPEVHISFDGAVTFQVEGILNSPARVVLTPSSELVQVRITGLTKDPFTVSNLHANAPVTIDGEKGTITEPNFDVIMTADMGNNKWLFRKYLQPNMFSPDTIDAYFIPSLSDIPANASYEQALLKDQTNLYQNGGDNYIGYIKTGLYVSSPKTVSLNFLHDDGAQIYLNGVSIYTSNHAEQTGILNLSLASGWNKIEILWAQHFGLDGIMNIQTLLSSQVEQLNAYYVKDTIPNGRVNKFPECNIWDFPVISRGYNGTQTISLWRPIDLPTEPPFIPATCAVDIYYKPKFL